MYLAHSKRTIGVQNKYGINTHLYGLIAAFGSFIYCIMEEYGWRGYLQEEFRFLQPVIPAQPPPSN